MSDTCRCGAQRVPEEDNRWHCGTFVDEDGRFIPSKECFSTQYRKAVKAVENLAEFRRGVHTAYHLHSAGELTAEDFVTEVAKLMIVMPEEDML